MVKIEYLIVFATWDEHEGYLANLSDGTEERFNDQLDLLNQLGDDGWNCFAILRKEESSLLRGMDFYFSRPKISL